MKRHFSVLLAFFFFFGATAHSQNSVHSFAIINDGGVNDIHQYINALDNNNLDKYRHIDQRTVFAFKRGVEVELFSANEMNNLGLPVDMTLVSRAEHAPVITSEFFIHPSGRILEQVKPVKKVSTPNQ